MVVELSRFDKHVQVKLESQQYNCKAEHCWANHHLKELLASITPPKLMHKPSQSLIVSMVNFNEIRSWRFFLENKKHVPPFNFVFQGGESHGIWKFRQQKSHTIQNWLVVEPTPFEKYARQIEIFLPQSFGVKIQKIFELPPPGPR